MATKYYVPQSHGGRVLWLGNLVTALLCVVNVLVSSGETCPAPTNLYTSDLSSSGFTLHWTSSSDVTKYSLRYRLSGSSQWIEQLNSLTDTFYHVTGLNPATSYSLQVVAFCPNSPKGKIAKITVVTAQSPTIPSRNILLIMLDDARYDYYSCNGAPPFLHTPNIDRIANEGVNFKKSFVVTSLCVPSRAAIATGLFTTRTGVNVNGEHLDTSFMTIPKFLKSQGYYTALIGKNHGIYLNGSVPEFDFYMVVNVHNSKKDTEYKYNGDTIQVNKPQSLTLTDTTIALIKRINQPFFIQLAYHDPHLEPSPLSSFIGRFDNEVIPWKPDTAKYTVNYPSWIYKSELNLLHGTDLDTTYRHIMEVMAGTDSCVGKILEALESSGKLDSTLIIFMSDNGHMMGSHWMSGKTVPYDPSMRVPIFMRYPKWFAPSSVVQDQMALNLDIAPTIYQFAKLQYPDTLDGLSLKKMYDGRVSRKQVYYVMLRDESASPSNRAIRDFHFKYVSYSCSSDTVEQLFDMVNDSLELNNLVNNHNYDSILTVYRLRLDSMKIAWDDTISSGVEACYIANPVYEKEMQDEEGEDFDLPVIYPTVTDGELEIYNPWPTAEIELFDGYGRRLEVFETSDLHMTLSLPALPDGMYIVRMTYQNKSFTQKIILQQ